MDQERSRKVEALYEAALEVETGRRAAFLAENCAGDESLRLEVESLLLHGDNAGGFLEVPALEILPEGGRPAVGQRVSHYEIQEKLGEGGMGVVYKARDTRLGRSVALKFVKAQFSERFEREARAVAALNHPHIATLYEVGEQEGAPYLAMEFVAGRPLKGPRPIKEVIEYGVQMAGALAAAHAAGIVHRDLKPANILVTDKGSVKILDFGLAKLRDRAGDGPPVTATLTGFSAGTPGYMSPEQIDGKSVDSRSDIFAFGCVLYELASGRHAFEGDSAGQVLAATSTQEPKPLDGIPEKLDELIRRCLRKDPERRVQHIGDARIALEELRAEWESGKPVAAAPEPRRARRRLWVAAISAAALLLATALVLWLRRGAPPEDLKAVPLTSYSGIEQQPSLSPDGSKVAFVWDGEKEDKSHIYVKQIGAGGPPMRLTTSPDADMFPTWSPDDRWIAFTRRQRGSVAIMVIRPLGGEERQLDVIPRASRLSWTPDAKWLAFAAQDSPAGPASIWAISIETGERRRLTTFLTNSLGNENPLGDSSPSISPDGRTLVFARQMKIWAFELYTLRLTRDLRPDGEPAKIASQSYGTVSGIAWTADGREIVYAAGADGVRPLWRVPVSGQRTPKRLPYVLPSASSPAIARTPPRLVYCWWVAKSNLWRLDTRTGERMKLIEKSASYSTSPQYSPDGRKIAFSSSRSWNWEFWTCDADGSNCMQLTSFKGPMCALPRWSPDGRWLTFCCNPEGQYEIYVMAADGGAARRLTHHDATDDMSSWSRDGRWIYFASDRSGRYEVWKMPRDGGEAVEVTRSGGYGQFESPDGRLLYYTKYPEPSPLFRMPAGGGAEEQVLPKVARFAGFGVTVKGVYFMPDATTIQFLDTATNKIGTLATLDKPSESNMCVSPDGAYVVWWQQEPSTADLMLVEGFR